jgi:hypothetical protein
MRALFSAGVLLSGVGIALFVFAPAGIDSPGYKLLGVVPLLMGILLLLFAGVEAVRRRMPPS